MKHEFLIILGGDSTGGAIVCVVEEKEIRNFGEYRTSRLVLKAWDKQGMRNAE